MGPIDATGKKVSAPMKRVVAKSITPNVGFSVPRVPADWAVARFAAIEPAMASGRMIGMNRARSMTMPVAKAPCEHWSAASSVHG